MVTRTRSINSFSQIYSGTRTKTINSFAYIKRPKIGDSLTVCGSGPFDSTEFDDVIWEETAREVIVRKMRDKDRVVDEYYGFEKNNGEEVLMKAIVHNVTARDGKLLESGFAKIGDFTIRFKADADVQERDVVYDPLFKVTYDLVKWPVNSYIGTNHLWKQFMGNQQ